MDSNLSHQVSRGSEPVQAEPLGVTGGTQRPMPNKAGTEQRGSLCVGKARGNWETEALVRNRILGVTTIDLIAGKPGSVA
jgi:hypothetical protein